MLKRFLVMALFVSVLLGPTVSSVLAAAPPPPPGPSPRMCSWQGELYSNGHVIEVAVYFGRTLLYHDFFRCVDGRWIYIGSSGE